MASLPRTGRDRLNRLRTWAFISKQKDYLIAQIRATFKSDPSKGDEWVATFLDQLRHQRLTLQMTSYVLGFAKFTCEICGKQAVYRVGIRGYCSEHREGANKDRQQFNVLRDHRKDYLGEIQDEKDARDKQWVSRRKYHSTKGTVNSWRNTR